MLDSLLSGWVLRGGINFALTSILNVNLFVAVWGTDTTVFQRAAYAVLADAVSCVWSAFGESQGVRAFIMRNYLRLHWSLIIADIALFPIFVISPYLYLIIFTVLCDGFWELAFMTMQNEVRETLLTNANARNSYLARAHKAMCAGSIAGAILAALFPLVEWGVWWMVCGWVVCSLLCGVMTTAIFLRTKRFMAEKKLVFPSCVVSAA